MSKITDAGQETEKVQEQETAHDGGKAEKYPPPLKPRRGLFVLFAILLVLLFAGMLAMYFTTVYPNRYSPHSVETDQPGGQK